MSGTRIAAVMGTSPWWSSSVLNVAGWAGPGVLVSEPMLVCMLSLVCKLSKNRSVQFRMVCLKNSLCFTHRCIPGLQETAYMMHDCFTFMYKFAICILVPDKQACEQACHKCLAPGCTALQPG